MKFASSLLGALFGLQFLLSKNAEGTNLPEGTDIKEPTSDNKIPRSLQGQDNLFKEFPNVPPQVLAKFKERNILKRNARPQFQEVKGESFKVNDETVSIADEDLVPVEDLFAPGATYSLNGQVQTELPKPSVFKSIQDDAVLVTKTSTGKLLWASKKRGNGKTVDVVPLEAGAEVFGTVASEDIDLFKLNRKFKYGEEQAFQPESLPGGGGRTRNLMDVFNKASHLEESKANHRSLQTCSEFEVIEVAIAYESTFCADFENNSTTATAAVMTIVSQASDFYQQPGLCMKVVVSDLDAYCIGDEGDDPYLQVMSATNVCGGGNSLLDRFRQFWTANKQNVTRDTAHLFHGKNLGSTIGCAYLDVLCRKDAGYGVNHITYTSNQNLWRILFAHELGHNAGSNHDCSSCNFIMRPSICSSCTTFSSSSISQINSHVDSVGCIDVEDPPTGCTSDVECDDGEDCTTDVCESSGTCSSTYDDTIAGCELCTSAQTPLDCDDGDACTDDTCNQVTGECFNTPVDCDDNDSCTVDSCSGGQCSNVLDTTLPGCGPDDECGETFDSCRNQPCCEGFRCWNAFPICIPEF